MPWVETDVMKPGCLDWVEPEVTDDTIVTLSIGELTAALAESLKVARVVQPAFKVGDKLTISVTVTGFNKNAVNVVFDNVPEEMHRSFSYHKVTLAAAVAA